MSHPTTNTTAQLADVLGSLGPFVRWAGGKRWLVDQLIPEIIACEPKLYLEPFLGGGAIALALPASIPKILNDSSAVLIDTYECFQKMPGLLRDELRRLEGGDIVGWRDQRDDGSIETGFDRAASYARAREAFNEIVMHPRKTFAKRAALFLYLNARCFNGLWRTNSQGRFNVPYGKLEKPRRLDDEDFDRYHQALKTSVLKSCDFAAILGEEFTKRSRSLRGPLTIESAKAVLANIVVFADPPYDGTFDGYSAEGFGDREQHVLARSLQSYAAMGAAVYATNADTPKIRELYAWARIESMTEQHAVGATGERRGKRNCVLIRGGSA